MVENDEIAILEVEAVQLVASGFGVHDILVDDEGGALCVVRNALADLPYRAESGDNMSVARICCDSAHEYLPAEEIIKVVGADVVAQILDE